MQAQTVYSPNHADLRGSTVASICHLLCDKDSMLLDLSLTLVMADKAAAWSSASAAPSYTAQGSPRVCLFTGMLLPGGRDTQATGCQKGGARLDVGQPHTGPAAYEGVSALFQVDGLRIV